MEQDRRQRRELAERTLDLEVDDERAHEVDELLGQQRESSCAVRLHDDADRVPDARR